MASRRFLKKNINKICNLVSVECMQVLVVSGPDMLLKLSDILGEVQKVRREFVSRISHTEPGNVKAYYRTLQKDFVSALDAIQDKAEGTVRK